MPTLAALRIKAKAAYARGHGNKQLKGYSRMPKERLATLLGDIVALSDHTMQPQNGDSHASREQILKLVKTAVDKARQQAAHEGRKASGQELRAAAFAAVRAIKRSSGSDRRKAYKEEFAARQEQYVASGKYKQMNIGGGSYKEIEKKKGTQAAQKALHTFLHKLATNALADQENKKNIEAEADSIKSGNNELLKHQLAAFNRIHPDLKTATTLAGFKQKNNIKDTVAQYQKELQLDSLLTHNSIMTRGKEISAALGKSPTVEDHARFRDMLMSKGISKEAAANLVDSKDFDASLDDKPGSRGVTAKAAQEFFQLTGGGGSSTLKTFRYTNPRAYAHKRYEEINVGSAEPSVIFHEMGHHLEYSDDRIEQAANDWLQKRATGEPRKLNDLLHTDSYEDNELARPGKFFHPYVAKIYSAHNKSTEVVSMGLQCFQNPAHMEQLYNRDKSHYHFVVGVLSAHHDLS